MYADFDWKAAPLNAFSAPCVGTVAYLIVVFLLPRVVPKGGFQSLRPVMVVHNMILSGWSLLMFCGCAYELFARRQQAQTWDWLFCEDMSVAKGPLYFWTYIFYISKYYEMFDTVLALLKGSSPPHFGLHVYHHALVPHMVWHWLEYCGTLQFPGLLFNAGVHVVMYAYYTLRLLNVPTPWKSWVTRLQIIQFMTSMGLLVTTVVYYLDGDMLNTRCSGMKVLWVNIVFNMTLLWQFVGVLFTTKKKERGDRATKGETSNGKVVTGKKVE